MLELLSVTIACDLQQKQWQSRSGDPEDFLELKEELFMFEVFLEHVFKKNEFSNKREKKTALSRQKNREPLVEEEPASPVIEEELM